MRRKKSMSGDTQPPAHYRIPAQPSAFTLCLLVCLLGIPPGIDGASLNFSNPLVRTNVVDELTYRNHSRKTRARAWAAANDAEMKFRMRGVQFELMDIRAGRPVYYRSLTRDAAISTGTDLVRSVVPYDLNGEGWSIRPLGFDLAANPAPGVPESARSNHGMGSLWSRTPCHLGCGCHRRLG